ncbi:MAG: hypothetical protein ACLTYP_01390 [Eubacterium sp.]|jgi:hypothetical protein|uniref:hypothetical protein n=1 Tax=Eubacterium sp. TaxID=142586 RepID=UPI0039967FCC
MIKETIDAVRVAEMEAEKQIQVAMDNAAGKKAELDSRKAQFRKEKLMKVQEEAKRAMDEVVSECKNYDLEMDKEIQMKVMELRDLAKERTDNAIKAVIQALA